MKNGTNQFNPIAQREQHHARGFSHNPSIIAHLDLKHKVKKSKDGVD